TPELAWTCVMTLEHLRRCALYHLCFFFYCYGEHRDLHSFPTRRSSDLGFAPDGVTPTLKLVDATETSSWDDWAQGFYPGTSKPRSEEHTSELQSRENLVCRLLLEKKK